MGILNKVQVTIMTNEELKSLLLPNFCTMNVVCETIKNWLSDHVQIYQNGRFPLLFRRDIPIEEHLYFAVKGYSPLYPKRTVIDSSYLKE